MTFKEERINQELVKAIKKAMKQKGIKQCHLADALGLNKSAITKFFKNNEFLNIKTLAKIETALDIQFFVDVKIKS